jgi:hypothetical protein
MAFTWLNKQGVKSSYGFELQFTGRFSAEYRTAGKIIEFYVESANGDIVVYESSMKKVAEGAADHLGIEDIYDKIVQNIREAMEFQGLNLRVVKDPDRSKVLIYRR